MQESTIQSTVHYLVDIQILQIPYSSYGYLFISIFRFSQFLIDY